MTSAPKAAVLICVLGLTGWSGNPCVAAEVYRWVDENGVVNFSDTAPAAAERNEKVDTLTLEDTTPPDYDPEADLYNVAAQAERMQALREQMEKERQERRERQRNAPTQPVVQYPQGVRYGYPYGYPVYPRPPFKPPVRPPDRPRPELYETSTLRPLGEMQNPDGR